DREQVRLEPLRRGVTAGAGADRVRLVDGQQRSGLAGGAPQRVVEARLRQDDADVGQSGLGQDAGNVAILEFPFERLDVVELDYAGRLGRLDRRADRSLALDHA